MRNYKRCAASESVSIMRCSNPKSRRAQPLRKKSPQMQTASDEDVMSVSARLVAQNRSAYEVLAE